MIYTNKGNHTYFIQFLFQNLCTHLGIEHPTLSNVGNYDNSYNQPTKFRRKSWIKINDKSSGAYKANSQIKFNSLILRSRFYD